MSVFINSSITKKWSLLIFEITVSHALLKTNQKWKVITKNKMDNPRFVDEEAIPLVRMNIMIVTVRGIQAG